MEELAERVRPLGVGSVFIYTHEAHPGEYYPRHTSFEQKARHAHAFRDAFQARRPILVDSLDGAAHRAYGGMPNMVWIIDRPGRPVYKADWTHAPSVQSAIDALMQMRDQRQAAVAVASFHVERLEYRPSQPEAFMAALERNGPRAAAEYRAQLERWRQRGRT